MKRMWFSMSATTCDADLDVAIEANAIGCAAEGWRLAHIVQQRAPGKRHAAPRLQLIEQHQGMRPHVALGMVERRLLNALHARDLRQHLSEQACCVKQFEGTARVALGEHFGQLVAHALAAYSVNARRERTDRAMCPWLYLESETSREAHRAQHAQAVFFQSLFRAANGANDAGIEIGEAANIVQNRIAKGFRIADALSQKAAAAHWAQGIEQETVDGEVAALHVFFGGVRIAHSVGMAAVCIGQVRAEGRDLDDEACAARLRRNQNHAEMRAHGEGAREHLQHHVRRRTGRHVEVGRFAAEQQIAHAAAG
jgi:hypothetical protein